jgi:hypothetical protein
MNGNGFDFFFLGRKIFPAGFTQSVVFGDRFFYKCIPLFAGRTLTQPFSTLLSAITAKESGFDFAHSLKVMAPLPESKKADYQSRPFTY